MLKNFPIRLWAFLGVLLVVYADVEARSAGRYVVDHGYRFRDAPDGAIPPNYRKQTVTYTTKYPVGTIIVDPANRYLYVVRGGNKASRYGVSVGAAAFTWSGEAYVQRKAIWPRWTPTREMIARDRKLSDYVDGVAPGPTNPMGARALYLYQSGHDTLYRIHGTSEYWSIGKASSSGCIRLLNVDIMGLYDEVRVGTKVVVLPSQNNLKWRH